MANDPDLAAEPPGARVTQVADVLGISPRETLRRLEERGVSLRSASAYIPGTVLADLLKERAGDVSLDKARQLVIDAFVAARASGKPEWQSMTVAVLKNRMLDATHGDFSEADYGAPSMPYLVWMLSDSVALCREGSVARVAIKEGVLPPERVELPAGEAGPAHSRVRPDLWRAIVDFSSGRVYRWDEREGCATVLGEGPVLPTLTRQEEAAWRADFVADVGVTGDLLTALEEWKHQASGTDRLPPALRGVWNGFLRGRVIERLEGFFQTNSITVPTDLETTNGAGHERGQDRVSELRRLLHACVDVMTEDEIRGLPVGLRILERAGVLGLESR